MKCRHWLLTVGLLIFLLFSTGLAAQDSSVRVDAIGFTVSDLDKSQEWFEKVLSFETVSDRELYSEELDRLMGVFGSRIRVARMRLGNEFIELTQFLTPQGRPIPPDSSSHDQWFQHIAIIVSDMEKAYQHLRQFKITHASTAPQILPKWNKNAADIKAFYFKDPDGHVLEILQFPPGKGDARWHQTQEEGKLFLGIDHTAIVVKNTDSSLHLYRDLLGMRIAGESENYGSEQEHLNNVFGARLRITTLRAESGPGIELLEYLSPSTGRSSPEDTKPQDIWFWQTHLKTDRLNEMAKAIIQGKYRLISPGVIHFAENILGFQAGIGFKDPDSHALFLLQN